MGEAAQSAKDTAKDTEIDTAEGTAEDADSASSEQEAEQQSDESLEIEMAGSHKVTNAWDSETGGAWDTTSDSLYEVSAWKGEERGYGLNNLGKPLTPWRAGWFCCPLCLKRTWAVADPERRRQQDKESNIRSLTRGFEGKPGIQM